MSTTPRLLETYEEARLLLEAKGWGLAKAAEHLREMRELARFHISHPKLSNKTKPGSKVPIEPDVAAAVEGMQTWRGYERQTEIVTAGLLAAHAGQPAAEVRKPTAGQRAWMFLRKLAGRLARASWRPVAITAASGALVAVLLVPLLSGRADAAGGVVVIIPGATADGSPLWFEPGTLAALSDPGGPKRPAEQQVPVKTLPGQKVAPCDAELGELALNGNCWIQMATLKPPCGRLFRDGDLCYRPVAADPKKPAP